MICCLNPDCSNPLNSDENKFCQACNTPLLGLLRNRFRVIRVLSDEGGFGRTYLSQDVDKLHERCVVKQLAPKFQGTWSQKKAMELFAEEAKRLQQLGEHPQIPTLLAYFEQDHCLYLVQQFINGENLLTELQKRKTYKEKEIQSILSDLLPILKFIHDRGVIHRDLKPENIIRRHSDGRLCLIDFGSSKQLTARVQNKIGTSIGSHGYSPIEQIRDGKAYPASDLFGLGTTCFHLLTGISPFQLWTEHGYSWVTNWRQYLRKPLDAELDRILDKLLQKDIRYRYQTVDEVIKDLSQKQPLRLLPGSKFSGKAPKTQTQHLPKKYNFLRLLILASAAILLFGFGDSWYKQFHRLQNSLLSRLSQQNNHSRNSEAVLGQQPKMTLRKISLANTLQGHENGILSVAISPDGRLFASNSDRTIKLWDIATGKEIFTLNGHTQRVNVVAISPNGKTLVSGSDDNTIKVWNLSTGKVIHTLIGHSDSVHTLVISPDGTTLASGSDDNTIKVWNLETGEHLRTLAGHEFWVRSMAISPDGKILASGSFDKTIKLWNLSKGYAIRTLKGDDKTITALAISPDGRTLASANRDRIIKLWNLSTGKEIRTLIGHDTTVTSLAISPDGQTLASGSRDRTIKLWNLFTGEEFLTLTGHTNTVTSLSISPDGKTLISGSEDNTIKIWYLSS
ncbi:MAG: protein kinase domain-containing protein [Aulosira sp. ZfuVER01]|nr:serine/threonine-protein kinase [Aulosira sp. ZfuVER01]MDZ8001245.1 serine/threonine-protein kinase [Aulosira sp. DedVER01a]MDZ8050902.1 serine/threonine-protein kinase [Aulosira sp. ZfuCHP01]